jgi:predicted ester cyclase
MTGRALLRISRGLLRRPPGAALPSAVMASNVDSVKVYWESCWNNRRKERLAEVFHDPYTHGRKQVSLARMATTIDETVASLPDVQVHVDETEVLGDVVITRSRFVATHGRVIFGLSLTGKAVDVPTHDIFFFHDGKVARHWHLTDHLPILVGIGADVRPALLQNRPHELRRARQWRECRCRSVRCTERLAAGVALHCHEAGLEQR